MHLVSHTFDEPEAELAFEESLLLEAEDSSNRMIDTETLRLWEFGRTVVVLGRSSRWQQETDVDYCQSQNIPILRRCSGGASVVGGPGCLMYSVVLDTEKHPGMADLGFVHLWVAERLQQAVNQSLMAWSGTGKDVSPRVEIQGTCDLTYQNRKISGNSMRRLRRHLLYHGTILYDANLSELAACLAFAPRQPEYRQGRDHDRFVTNVPVDPATLRENLQAVFVGNDHVANSDEMNSAGGPGLAESVSGPHHVAGALKRSDILLSERYRTPAWHFRH